MEFRNFIDYNNKNSNAILYISDFENKNESTGKTKPHTKLMIRRQKPITTVFNQNIIPQEGLFIFNPFGEKSLEENFNVSSNSEGWNFKLTPFDCFNIHKDLAKDLRKKWKLNIISIANLFILIYLKM